jgi:hypothetical protein
VSVCLQESAHVFSDWTVCVLWSDDVIDLNLAVGRCAVVETIGCSSFITRVGSVKRVVIVAVWLTRFAYQWWWWSVHNSSVE